jgi:hypothetical protein
VTHPPGRRTCLHCGGRVLPSRDATAAVEPRDVPFLPGSEPDEQEPPQRSVRMRLASTLVWIVLALAAAVFRICQDRPGAP